MRIPFHIQNLKNYKPGKPNAIDDSDPITVLCSNENNFGPSPMVIEAIKMNADKIYQYPDPTGNVLRKKIGEKLGLSEEWILLGMGSDNILYTCFLAYFLPGENIVTSYGSFVSIDAMAHMNQVKVKKVPLKAFAYDLDGILKAIDKNTRAIYISNPNNPTGTVLSEREIKIFMDEVPEDVLVILDEAYYEYATDLFPSYGESTKWRYDNLLILRTFSKAYGLAGLRIGYGIGHPEILSALWKVKPTFAPGVLALIAAEASLSDDEHLMKTLVNNRILINKYYALLDEYSIDYITTATNFVTVYFSQEVDAISLCDQLKANKILVRHLKSFGLDEMVRISTGTERDFQALSAAIGRIYDPVLQC